ncbi:MAG: energy-coupling factor transporter transmembrane protein EcfT [Candidatus Lokiarchaeota archaeon]|nr:energy-coupling factor transporter transmembrane protein EcfT [Candidatus Lokiarchaeota archaeon]
MFLEAFKFLKKDTFLHRLDPRSKLLMAIFYSIFSFLFLKIIPLLLILLTMIPLVISGKQLKKWLTNLKNMYFLFVLIILINTLFFSLNFALLMVLRIIIMLSAFTLFFQTVDPNDLALSFISMKIPYEIAFSFSLAFRFIPTIAMEAENIKDAQQSRGYELQASGMINKIKNLFPLIVPLIICSIKRAFNVAEALESRAFGSRKNRTHYFTVKYAIMDWLFTAYLILLLIFLIYIQINIGQLIVLNWSFPL